ncbi:hypothetical protein G6F63_015111 [Rhizopus arrhizus]|nr:hypothetical protein G6F63_015111 [Rhizopus arrhizus]
MALGQRMDVHLPHGVDLDFAVGAVQGQGVDDVAVGIHLRLDLAGRLDLPPQRMLVVVAPGRQAQRLDAVVHRGGIAVAGHVLDEMLHEGLQGSRWQRRGRPPPGPAGTTIDSSNGSLK